MKMLAMELSSRRGSVALAEDSSVYDEVAWEGPQSRGEQVFGAIGELLERQGLLAADIDVFALGRGPGGFSGIRMAVTAAQAFALPRDRRVVAVSSGAALARAVGSEHAGRPVAVVGDARRGTWWWGLFDAAGAQIQDWKASDPDAVRAGIPGDAIIASPDWERLAGAAGDDPRWIRSACHPSAAHIARLAWGVLERGEPGEPVEPIYLHAAV